MSDLNHPHDHVIVQRMRFVWLLLDLVALLRRLVSFPRLGHAWVRQFQTLI